MKIFSDELSMQAIIKNTQLGFRVLIDEWYWLLLQPCHNYRIKQFDKDIALAVDEEQKNLLIQRKEELIQGYSSFREMQIQTRIKAYL